MKKFLLLGLSTTMLMFPLGVAQAQDTLIIDQGNDSVIEGVVKIVRSNDVVIDVSGKEITVEIDKLNIDTKADEYFPIGTKVQVVGNLADDDEMIARKMIRLEVAPEPEIPPLEK